MPRRFSDEFKRKAVQLYLSRGKDRFVASELDISPITLEKWERALRNELNPVMVSEAEKLKCAQKELKRLREENEILKKAAAFFAAQEMKKH